MHKDSQQQIEYPSVFYTVWQEAWASISKPRHYLVWTKQPMSRSFSYFLFIHVVLSLVMTGFFFINLQPVLQQVEEEFSSSFPSLSYTPGALSIVGDKSYSFTDNQSVFFKIDTKESIQDEPTIDSFYEIGLLLTKDGAVSSINGEISIYPYTDLLNNSFELTGEQLGREVQTFLNWSWIVVPLFLCLYLVITKFIFALFFAFVYYLFSLRKLNLQHLMALSLYALTPATLVSYLSFIFYPISGAYTLTFLIYMTMVLYYYRKSVMPSVVIKKS